jgi:hypothetical protein
VEFLERKLLPGRDALGRQRQTRSRTARRRVTASLAAKSTAALYSLVASERGKPAAQQMLATSSPRPTWAGRLRVVAWSRTACRRRSSCQG